MVNDGKCFAFETPTTNKRYQHQTSKKSPPTADSPVHHRLQNRSTSNFDCWDLRGGRNFRLLGCSVGRKFRIRMVS